MGSHDEGHAAAYSEIVNFHILKFSREGRSGTVDQHVDWSQLLLGLRMKNTRSVLELNATIAAQS